jgi:phosphopantothenoylcysteine decarboxylase/phosphopantothenate--cysteine ligase
MGYAIARAAIEAGAEVTLISGPVTIEAPAAARLLKVESGQDMFDAVSANVPSCDIFIGVAAVADYHVKNHSLQKIKKERGVPTLELAPNPDIIETVASRPNPPFCVGFAAETEKLAEHAELKRRRKKLPLLAANLAQSAIGSDDNELLLLDDAGTHALPRGPKLEQARGLIRHLAKLYKPRKSAIAV